MILRTECRRIKFDRIDNTAPYAWKYLLEISFAKCISNLVQTAMAMLLKKNRKKLCCFRFVAF